MDAGELAKLSHELHAMQERLESLRDQTAAKWGDDTTERLSDLLEEAAQAVFDSYSEVSELQSKS